MKTSNKILLTTGAIPFLCVFILVLSLKLLPLEAKISDATPADKSGWITRTIPLNDFNSISSVGGWEIHLAQSDDYLIEIKAPEDVMEMISVKNVDQELSLGYSNVPGKSRNEQKAEVLISLPSLSEINMKGASDLYFQKLTIDSLRINADGKLKLSGIDSSIGSLYFFCNGLLTADLSETKVTNANVSCNGIFTMDLLMSGGSLKGNLNGMGTLTCQGRAESVQMRTHSPFCRFVSKMGMPIVSNMGMSKNIAPPPVSVQPPAIP